MAGEQFFGVGFGFPTYNQVISLYPKFKEVLL